MKPIPVAPALVQGCRRRGRTDLGTCRAKNPPQVGLSAALWAAVGRFEISHPVVSLERLDVANASGLRACHITRLQPAPACAKILAHLSHGGTPQRQTKSAGREDGRKRKVGKACGGRGGSGRACEGVLGAKGASNAGPLFAELWQAAQGK